MAPESSFAQSVSFASAIEIPTGHAPNSVAVGDFNKDGRDDLAVASTADNALSVHLADGPGSFRPPTHWSVGSAPVSVAVGDFNSDGNPDVASANADSGTVSILFGDGLGEFAPALHCQVGSSPYAVAAGDVDRDGKTDLVAANFFGNSVSVLISDGTESCGTLATYSTGAGTTDVAIADPADPAIRDLNRDGKPDLVSANFYSNSVSVLLGNGTGSFGPASDFPAGDGATFVAIGDLNQDGKPDLAVATAYAPSVSILLGNGQGAFAVPIPIPVLAGPQSVEIEDFNRDGKPDLAVIYTMTNVVSILSGNGDGTFGTAMNCTGGGGPSDFDRLATGDFNQDDKPDLAVVNTSEHSVSILLNTTVTAAGSKPDLSVYSLSASIAGAYISVSDVQRNNGTLWAGPSVASFYFAANPSLPTAGTLIGTRDVSGIAAGRYNSATTKFAIPDATPTGTYYVCAYTDSGGAVDELDEQNNARCTGTTYLIGPDLTVSTVTATKSGASLYVSDGQRNIGSRGTAGPFTVAFYLSLDTTFDAGDGFLGSRSVSSLAGGGTTDSKTTRFTIPDGIAPASYRVLAVSDVGNAVIELNESNNSKSTTGTYRLP